MVKCCIFMIGLVILIAGIGALIIGVSNAWYYGEFRVGLVIGPICLFLGILFLYYSDKWETDERRAKAEREKQRVEEEAKQTEIAEMEKAKQVFLKQKEWNKEWEAEKKSVFCITCGNELTPEQSYCEKCGTPKKES